MNNQMPGMMPYQFMPFNPNQNQGFGNNNCNMCQEQLANLENRINRLERQLRRLENRIMQCHGNNANQTPYNDNQDYGQNNQGMYML
ncbi:MAG: hypothetical protein RSD40_04200 [Bacilli bacterium]